MNFCLKFEGLPIPNPWQTWKKHNGMNSVDVTLSWDLKEQHTIHLILQKFHLDFVWTFLQLFAKTSSEVKFFKMSKKQLTNS